MVVLAIKYIYYIYIGSNQNGHILLDALLNELGTNARLTGHSIAFSQQFNITGSQILLFFLF